MIPLKESLLGKTKDKVNKAVDTINHMLFGDIFKFKYGHSISSKTTMCISVSGMKRLTKGMDYIDKYVERGLFDRQDKAKMLCNYIEHINLGDWGFFDVDWEKDEAKRKEFVSKLNETLAANGCYNKGGRCWCNSYSFRTPNDGFLISFANFNNTRSCDVFMLEFEYR
jgi:hypothetical protein